MRGGLWSTTLWVWNLRDLDLTDFIARVAALPGDRGVIIKAADGRYPWAQWEPGIVNRFREAGIGVGLWVFQYGRGVATYSSGQERPGVQAELGALGLVLGRSWPDCVVLNIEDQVMGSPDPAADVRALVNGATDMAGLVGLSTVWHWADSMGWPFGAAVDGGLAYWSNQVYGRDWKSWSEYARLYAAHGAKLPDYISLNANQAASGMVADGAWSQTQAAPGVAWWEAASVAGSKWVAVREVASMVSNADPADLAFDAYAVAHPEIGQIKHPGAGRLNRPWAGDKVAFYEGATLAYTYATNTLADITSQTIDDFRTYAEQDGSLVLY